MSTKEAEVGGSGDLWEIQGEIMKDIWVYYNDLTVLPHHFIPFYGLNLG